MRQKISIDSGGTRASSSNGAAARSRSTALSSKFGQCHVDSRVDEAEHRLVVEVSCVLLQSYLIIPAVNVYSRSAELHNVNEWALANNLRLNLTKSQEIILDLRFVLFLCTTVVWQFAINEYVV